MMEETLVYSSNESSIGGFNQDLSIKKSEIKSGRRIPTNSKNTNILKRLNGANKIKSGDTTYYEISE